MMAYFNPILHEVLMKERKRAFEDEADRRQLIQIADGQRPQSIKNIRVAIRKLVKKSPVAQGSGGDRSFRPELSK
jgi:hypothetical protein